MKDEHMTREMVAFNAQLRVLEVLCCMDTVHEDMFVLARKIAENLEAPVFTEGGAVDDALVRETMERFKKRQEDAFAMYKMWLELRQNTKEEEEDT